MAIVQVAQRVIDLDRAEAFYASFLRQAPDARFVPPGLVFFNLDGVRLLLDDKAPSALIYFTVDDINASVERLRAAGVEIISEPHIIFQHADDRIGPAGHDEWMAFFTDSEGNTVGLVEHRPSA
jgi:methylmalonyl-CoA/ethylmalonyl-CoA epimerase